MVEINYLTKEEQKAWEYLKDKEIIDNELFNQIFPEIKENKRNKLLHNLYKKGYLNKARKDLYYNPKTLKGFHKLALRYKEGYIALTSALRHYNLTDYEDFTIFIATKSFQKKISLKGTEYSINFIPLHDLYIGFTKTKDIYISTIEKTIFDCLLKPNLIGLQNITKAIYDAKIDWKKLLEFFKLTNNNALKQRTGYILELLKTETKLKIPEFVFNYLADNIKDRVKLTPLKSKSIYDNKWKIQDNLGKENILSWWQ